MKIEVLNRPLDEGKFTNKATGEISITRKQWATIEVDGISTPFQMYVRDGEPPYAAGLYEFSAGSFGLVNGGLTLNKYLRLVPLKKGA